MITFSKIEERVKEQYHCWIIRKSLCVNLCASWQGRLANMPNLYSHSRKHSQQDCLLQNRRGTAPESREPDSQHDYFLKNRREGKGTVPLLDNWKVPVCQPLCFVAR
ncbi:hypothetical protein ACFX15_001437 [Malus domestica]